MEGADLAKLESYRDYARRENRTLWLEKTACDLIVASPGGQEWMLKHQDPGSAVDVTIGGVRFQFMPIRN